MKPQLTAQDWLHHGLRTLAQEGPAGLKADRLARALGVSRGSFYWHFEDLFAFKTALLAYWQTVTTERVIEVIEEEADNDRLPTLMQEVFASDDSLERAIRAWAVQAPSVQKAVAEVDHLRIDYLVKLLRDAGLAEAHARTRATFIYAASLGRSQIWAEDLGLDPTAIADIADLMQDANVLWRAGGGS